MATEVPPLRFAGSVPGSTRPSFAPFGSRDEVPPLAARRACAASAGAGSHRSVRARSGLPRGALTSSAVSALPSVVQADHLPVAASRVRTWAEPSSRDPFLSSQLSETSWNVWDTVAPAPSFPAPCVVSDLVTVDAGLTCAAAAWSGEFAMAAVTTPAPLTTTAPTVSQARFFRLSSR
jgi:hypothetical protein